MTNRLMNIFVFILIAVFVSIQIDEYNEPLIVGHKALLGVCIISVFMAIYNAISLIHYIMCDDLDYIEN